LLKKSGATIADTIVLAGVVGLEQAIKKGGSKVKFHLLRVEVMLRKIKLILKALLYLNLRMTHSEIG
jgi:Catalase (peroxidase I)